MRSPLLMALLVTGLVVGCGRERNRARPEKSDTPKTEATEGAEEEGGDDKSRRRGKSRKSAASDRVVALADVKAPKMVVFAVLDTLRADHTSLCGYERPTTPVLEAIVSKRGASYACKAYSPAPWTHPSHATFFTGRSVVEHAAIWVTESSVHINPVTRVRPVAFGHETIAELFGRAGYQTVAITANMIITRPSGLLQGFDHIHIAKDPSAMRGDRFLREVKKTFKGLDPNKPTFVFLNYYDAHDPYPQIPEDIDWVPSQPQENLHPNQHDEKHEYYRYVKGLSSAEEAAPFLERVTNGYDWGVHMADRGLGLTMKWFEAEGWLDDGYRMVVTSDHGEFLGEHRLLRHGGYIYEPVVNVPYLFVDTTLESQPELPEPFSGQNTFHLLATGTLPEDAPPAHAVSEPNEHDILVGRLGGAIWSGQEKLVCADGVKQRFDLGADPGELSPGPVEGSALASQLDDLCTKAKEMFELPPPSDDDDEAVRKALQAVGYMEDDKEEPSDPSEVHVP